MDVIIRANTFVIHLNLSRVMRKPAFCICENKDADQLRVNREADQRLCFRYIDRTSLYFLNLQNFKPLSSVSLQPGLCQTWSETPKSGFLIASAAHRQTRCAYLMNKFWFQVCLSIKARFLKFALNKFTPDRTDF